MPIQTSDLCPAFATFKPFRLVSILEKNDGAQPVFMGFQQPITHS